MSDDLSQEQLQDLKAQLQKTRDELQGQLQRLDEDSQPVQLDQQSVGRLSRMDAMQQQQMATANSAHIRAHLSRVERALAAMETGDYGYCADCDEAIPFARLQIRPDSPLCVSCQQRNET